MTDHAVLIPTADGPLGGVVSEPPGEAHAAALLLAGYGRPARSGINGFWTRMARELAARGVVVLRVDHCREGETLPLGQGVRGQQQRTDLAMLLLEQAIEWFRARLPGRELHVAGACAGARLAIEIAAADPAVAQSYLVVPPLAVPMGVERSHRNAPPTAEPGDLDPDVVDPLIVERFRTILAHGSSWILVGERDDVDVAALRRLLGHRSAGLEVAVVPDLALHFLDQPDIQREAGRRLVDRLLAVAAARR